MENLESTGLENEMDRVEYTDTSVVVTLLEPLTFRPGKLDPERTIESLTLPRKVLGRHMKAMDQGQGEIAKTFALIAALARIPVRAVEDMDARDIDLVTEVMEPFLPGSQAIGRR